MTRMHLRRIVCLVLAVLMLTVAFAGCAKTTTAEESKEQTTEPTPPAATEKEEEKPAEQTPEQVEDTTGVTFPLAEPYTIKMMFKGNADYDLLEKNEFYKQLCEETNVYIEWINLGDEPMTTLNAMLAAGTEGDVIFGGVLNDSTLTELAYGGFLLPIEEYITDENIMPNYVTRGLAEVPSAVGNMTLPDGHIYSVARFDSNPAAYLESPLYVNKDWIAQAGLDNVDTIEKFEEYLIYVRDHDMNGDGNPNDEVPMLLATSSANPYATIQAMLGWWGMPTKDSALDSYVVVTDGKVELAPTMDAYKEAISTISRWYQEGLIWSELYTANKDSFNARLDNDVACWGATMVQKPTPSTTYYKDLECVLYPSIEGYTPRAYYNCGFNGYKNTFTLTKKCEKPEVVLAWLDKFYSLQGTRDCLYGPVSTWTEGTAYPRYEIDAEGKITEFSLDKEQAEYNNTNYPTFYSMWGSYIFLRSAEDYNTGAIGINEATQKLRDAYGLYQDICNKEIWPRPYYTSEDSEQIAFLRTDVFGIITEYEAQWVTGQADINADWDSFQSQLTAAGADQLVQLLQNAYDNYLAANS